MLFNEKYGITHINYNTGWILVDCADDEYSEDETFGLDGIIRGFSRLIGGERESLGMMQYRIDKSPYEFVLHYDTTHGIVIIVEDMRRLDETVKYIKNSIQEINYNMLYEEKDYY